MIANGRSGQAGMAAVAAADAVVAAALLCASFLLREHVLPHVHAVWDGPIRISPSFELLLTGSLPILLGALYFAGGYDWRRLRGKGSIFRTVAKAEALGAIGLAAYAYMLRDQVFSRAVVVTYLLLTTGGFVAVRIVGRRALVSLGRRGVGMDDAIIVGTGPAAGQMAAVIARRPDLGLRVVGFVSAPDEPDADPARPTLGAVTDLPAIVDRQVVDSVIFATGLDVSCRYEKVIWKLEEVGKTVHLRGDAIGVLLSRTFIGEFEGTPIVTLRSTPADPLALAVKRTLDVVGAALGLAVLSPLFAAAALAIKLTSRGPVLFRQERVGLNGRRFAMIKFRSMRVDAEARLAELREGNEMTGPVFKMARDPRVTPVGRWLRRLSIDELPQLWNVFVGEMSLVGPRPPIPGEVEQYERWQRRRLSMKPGLTCLWQVGGRNELSFDTWMKLDMEYIDNWSLLLDFKILLRTVPVVLSMKGAR